MDVQKTPFGGVEDKVYYIRCGNIKFNTQSLRLRYQETPKPEGCYSQLAVEEQKGQCGIDLNHIKTGPDDYKQLLSPSGPHF